MVKPRKRGLTQQQVLLTHGVRSGLEGSVCKDLTDRGVDYEYESRKLSYVRPEKRHTYTPDIFLPNGLVLELKGRLTLADRQKMVLVKEQHPDQDIRFVFSNSRTKISKGSATTYGMWAEKQGFPYCDKRIPDDWLL